MGINNSFLHKEKIRSLECAPHLQTLSLCFFRNDYPLEAALQVPFNIEALLTFNQMERLGVGITVDVVVEFLKGRN